MTATDGAAVRCSDACGDCSFSIPPIRSETELKTLRLCSCYPREMTSRAATKKSGMEPPQNHVGRSMMTALGTWELTPQTQPETTINGHIATNGTVRLSRTQKGHDRRVVNGSPENCLHACVPSSANAQTTNVHERP